MEKIPRHNIFKNHDTAKHIQDPNYHLIEITGCNSTELAAADPQKGEGPILTCFKSVVFPFYIFNPIQRKGTSIEVDLP